MKKRIAIATTLVALVAITAAPMAYAGPGGHGGHRGGRGLGIFGHLGHMQEKLDLTDQQTAQLKGIFAELHTLNEPYREQLRGGFEAIAQKLLQNPDDVAGAQALLDQQAAAEKALKANLLSATSKALNVLTADQRAQLAELIAQRGERRGRMRR
jgi:Spy/CpxP family protein refolding chaperone